MPDFITIEIHYVDVIGCRPFASGWARTALASMRARENGVGTDVLSFIVGGKRLDLISRVGHECQKSLHPFGVLFQAFYVSDWLRLRGESRICRAIGFTWENLKKGGK